MSQVSQALEKKIARVEADLAIKERELDDKVQEVESLRVKLNLWRELLTEEKPPQYRDLILDAQPPFSAVQPPAEKYASFGLSAAVRDSLRSFPHGATATQVRDYILKHGYKPTGEHIHNSVTTALIRLIGKGVEKIQPPGERPKYLLSAEKSAAA